MILGGIHKISYRISYTWQNKSEIVHVHYITSDNLR